MKDRITNLIQLQDCDNRIKKINQSKREGPVRIQKLEEELNTYEERFRQELERLDSLKIESRKIEQEILDLEKRVRAKTG